MIRVTQLCQYCNRRYIGCHSKCYDEFLYQCWRKWNKEIIRKAKDEANEYKACQEAKHERLKHWDRRVKRY